MSNVSWCGGPPGSHTKMTAGSLVVPSEPLARNGVTGAAAADATATEPNLSTSRRLGPGQGRAGIATGSADAGVGGRLGNSLPGARAEVKGAERGRVSAPCVRVGRTNGSARGADATPLG